MGKSISNLEAVTRVGLDLAKNVFQVHGVDAKGETRRRTQGAARRAGRVLRQAAAMPGCDGGVFVGASLGAALAELPLR